MRHRICSHISNPTGPSQHLSFSIHHEGGFANGTDALCLLLGELHVGDMDILLGTVRGVSLDSVTAKRFFVRSQPLETR